MILSENRQVVKDDLSIHYDANGSVVSVNYNGTEYYYLKNGQGDIVGLIDGNGTRVVNYEYDSWGKLISTTGTLAGTLGVDNPLRYRGYYYDGETGLYYLQSRYYDAEVGRFISGDEIIAAVGDSLIGYNMYAYCFNNPVNMTDGTGSWPEWATKVAIGAAVIAAAAIVTVATGGAAAGTLVAAVNCVAAGALQGAVVQGAIGAATGAVGGAVTHRITTGSWEGAGEAALNGAADGFMTGTITGAITGGVSNKVNNLCFVAGTMVQTAAGVIAIECIKAGDYVWAWNEDSDVVSLKQVVETYINETDELIHVCVEGEEIVTTPSHPFYSPIRGWTDAADLWAGDVLVLVNGEYAVVEWVQHEILESSIQVYNFQVEDDHTYYVSNKGILVHNRCLVDKEGVRVEVRTSNEHGLPHGHVSGNGPNTTIGLDRKPMKNHPYFSRKQSRIIQENWETIRNGIIEFFPK